MNRPEVVVSQRARLVIMGAVMLGLFLSALDQTVVGTALPRIVTDLGGNQLYVWVVTAYLVTSTVTVPVYGKLSDLYGRKLLLIIGISVFLAGSALSGLSQNMGELIVFRGLQGIGAGALFPIALAVIGDLFTPRERGRYQGLFGAVFGVSFLVGPFLGGYITDTIGWHWVFYVNLPIGLVALAVIASVLPNHRREGASPSLDYLGVAVFTLAVIPLLIGLTEKGFTSSGGQSYSWLDWRVGGLILLSAVLGAVFVFVESRAKEPIVPLDLFRDRTYSAAQAATFLISFAFFIGVIFMPRYFQAVRGISATASGYMVWPLLVGLMGTSVISGIMISHTGKYKKLIVAAMAVATLGMVLMTQLTAGTSDWVLWGWMLVMGIGVGPSMSAFTLVVQNSVPIQRLGVATSTLTFFRQVGGSIGLAIGGSYLTTSFVSQLPQQLHKQGVPAAVVHRFSSQAASNSSLTGVGNLTAELAHVLPPPLRYLAADIARGIHDSLAMAIGGTFWIGAVVAALSVLAALLMRELPLRTTLEAPAAPNVVAAEDKPPELVASL